LEWVRYREESDEMISQLMEQTLSNIYSPASLFGEQPTSLQKSKMSQ